MNELEASEKLSFANSPPSSMNRLGQIAAMIELKSRVGKFTKKLNAVQFAFIILPLNGRSVPVL